MTHLDRSVFLTGTLSPPIIINSTKPIKTASYGVGMEQSINVDQLFMQGGPGKSVSEFKGKSVKGNIKLPLRINESGVLEDGVKVLLSVGQNYTESFTLTTLILPYNGDITAEAEPFRYTTNSLIFDLCAIEDLTITASTTSGVNLSVGVLGETDYPNTLPISTPSDDANIYRNLTWQDCLFTRSGSQFDNLQEVELKIVKNLDQPFFLIPVSDVQRYDRPYSTGVMAVGVEIVFIEHLTSVFDIFNFSFGGYADDVNISGTIGPITFSIANATFTISSEPLDANIIKRTTKAFFRMRPDTPDTNNFLLQY